MQIQISWLFQNLEDLHCFHRQGISGFSRTWVKMGIRIFLSGTFVLLLNSLTSLEVSQQEASNEYPQHMFLFRNRKIHVSMLFG